MNRKRTVFACAAAVGATFLVLAVHVWRSRSVCSAAANTFALKYAAMLQKEKREQEKCDEHSQGDARVMIFYGSSSGNAESYARALVADLKERGVQSKLINPSCWEHLDCYCLNQQQGKQRLFPLSEGEEAKIAVFIVSTTGEGEVPENFLPLYDAMHAAVQKNSKVCEQKPFDGFLYAMFALGDSSYKYYCRGGLNVNALLRKGGATELLPICLGDARSFLVENFFEEWEENLMTALEQKCKLPLSAWSDEPPKPQLVFRFVPERFADMSPFAAPPSLLEPAMHCPAEFKLLAKTPRTERRDDGSFILHLVFSFDGYTVSYQAGDHLGIYPINPPDVVEKYRKVLNISAKDWLTPVELCSASSARARASLKNTFPARVTLKTVFERYLDLCGRPIKSTLRVLAKYCSDPKEKELFMSLLQRGLKENEEKIAQNKSSSHSDFFYNYNFCTIADYLEQFPSCHRRMPIGHFLEIMPRMRPRFYSVASDMMTHPKTVEIFVRIRPDGLNSRYMQRIFVGEKVTAFIRKSRFHLSTKNCDQPVIMISAGTGVAPMIGFCYRRAALMSRRPNAKYGPILFFFGAQKRASEYFVRNELESWCCHEEGTLQATNQSQVSLLTLFDVAFSRDQPEKYYVTHLIEKHKDYILKLLNSTANGGCFIYLSGDATNMARCVDETLVKVLQYGGMTYAAARDYLGRMEQKCKYMKDVY